MQVKVIFYGLCAFVPEKDPQSMTGNDGKLRVLLPDARSPNPDAKMTVHRPLLRYFDGSDCVELDAIAQEVGIVGGPAREPKPLAGGVNFRKVPTGMSRYASPSGSSQTRHFQWLEKVGDSFAKYRAVKKSLLSGEVKDGVAMRVVLSGGSFRTGAVTNYKGDPIRWEFKALPSEMPDEAIRRTLAFQMVWEADVENPQVSRFDEATGSTQYTRLGPRKDAEYAEVWVTNLSPPDAAKGSGEAALTSRDEDDGQEIAEDRNYRWFYTLADQYKAGDLPTAPFPWPTRHQNKKGGVLAACDYVENFAPKGGGPVRCPQAQFAPAEA